MPGCRNALLVRRRIACVFATGLVAIAVPSAQQLPVRIALRVDAPARIGMPIWVYADLPVSSHLTARYPFGDHPRYFGSHHLELKRDGQILTPIEGLRPMQQLVGSTVGSIAPATSPQNRLPLHLGFTIDRPGRYSVRWSVIAESFGRAAASPDILAQSDWLDFDVTEAPAERERWLTALLAAPPADPGLYVGDFLPSLLASMSDPRVPAAVIDGTYTPQDLVANCTLAAFGLWPAEIAVPLVMGRLQRPGPNKSLAYFISWHAPWFQDRREDVIRSAMAALQSPDDVLVQGGLQILSFAEHFDWPASAVALDDASRALIAAAPSILARNERVVHTLALALGTTPDAAAAAPLLQQIVDRRTSASEQARIALGWLSQRGQPRPVGSTVGPAVLKLQSKDAADRRAAAQALIELGSSQAQPAVAQSVGANLLDAIIRRRRFVDNEDAWRDAVLILGRLRAAVYAGSLTLYLIHDGPTDALIEMGEPAVPAVTDILKVGGPQRRRLAAGVLGAVGGSAASVALTAARASETDAQVRNAIEYALAHLGERPPRAEIR